MELDKAIQSRTSVRKFKSKKPDWRAILEAIDAARYAPMAGNNYTVKFIVVDEPQKIQKLADAAQQDRIANSHYVVVVVSNPSRTINAYGERAEKYLRQQAGAAIENFLLKIEDVGLSSCWVGHFVDHMVKDILSIPDGVEVEALLPVGYKFENQKKKMNANPDEILRFNSFRNKKMNPPKKLEV